jgi:hypothetical protein
MSLVKAELEDLRDDNPAQVALVVANKACVACGVRFGRFKWGRQCVVCDLSVCGSCAFKFVPLPHMQHDLAKLSFDKTKGPSICRDCRDEITAPPPTG